MKYLLMLFPFAALAIDPSLPVVRVDGGEIVERRQQLPDRYGSTVNYRSAFYRWADDGWRQATIRTETNSVTVAIPQPIQSVAAAYKAAMENIYGEGAVTNRALTRAAVAIDLSLREDVSAEVALRLQAWFEILNEYWERGEVWSFPYDASEYTNTTTTTVWEVTGDE
jgi:hypothetical protein